MPLDEGSLSGTFTYETIFDDWRKYYFTPKRLKVTVDKVNKIKEKLVRPGRTMTQIALRFCLFPLIRKPWVLSLGMKDKSGNKPKEMRIKKDFGFSEADVNLIKRYRGLSALGGLLDDTADVAIVGMRNPNHVEENCKSVDMTLTEEEIVYIKKQKWLRNFYPEDV